VGRSCNSTIPNQVIRKLYAERLQEQMYCRATKIRNSDKRLCKTFYATGDLGPLCDLLEQTLFQGVRQSRSALEQRAGH
jgi:hypothetical protein